ncbi:MAG: hypothetical protein AAF206_28605 [Bacteroidota bacterium]
MQTLSTPPVFPAGRIFRVVILCSLWIHISEVARYFLLIRAKMKSDFPELPHVADMNTGIFMIWGLWDTLLTAVCVIILWLMQQQFDRSRQTILQAATLSWLALFVILWVGIANMGVGKWDTLWLALPWAWIELVVCSCLATRLLGEE